MMIYEYGSTPYHAWSGFLNLVTLLLWGVYGAFSIYMLIAIKYVSLTF